MAVSREPSGPAPSLAIATPVRGNSTRTVARRARCTVPTISDRSAERARSVAIGQQELLTGLARTNVALTDVALLDVTSRVAPQIESRREPRSPLRCAPCLCPAWTARGRPIRQSTKGEGRAKCQGEPEVGPAMAPRIPFHMFESQPGPKLTELMTRAPEWKPSVRASGRDVTQRKSAPSGEYEVIARANEVAPCVRQTIDRRRDQSSATPLRQGHEDGHELHHAETSPRNG